MVTIKGSLGSTAALTATLTSMANAAGRVATQYDGDTNFPTKGWISATITCGASPVAGSRVELYLAYSDAETVGENITDGLSLTDAALGTKPINVKSIGAIATLGTTYEELKKVIPVFDLPRKWSLIIWNSTGDALSPTAEAFEIKFIPQYDETV